MADRSVSDAVDRQISTTLLGAWDSGNHILFGHRFRCRLLFPRHSETHKRPSRRMGSNERCPRLVGSSTRGPLWFKIPRNISWQNRDLLGFVGNPLLTPLWIFTSHFTFEFIQVCESAGWPRFRDFTRQNI